MDNLLNIYINSKANKIVEEALGLTRSNNFYSMKDCIKAMQIAEDIEMIGKLQERVEENYESIANSVRIRHPRVKTFRVN